MKLLVCGGAGFIGSNFVRRRLSTTDDEIVVLDKLTYAGNRANLAELEVDPGLANRLRFVRGDICAADLVRRLAPAADAVVNFAAESHVDRSVLDSAAFLRTGVEGVRVLLDALRDVRRPVRFVQVSTDEVYGPRPEGASAETDPLLPSSPYAAAKAAGDLLVGAYHSTFGMDVVITRGSNTYGPHQHPEKLVALAITNALSDLPVPIYGDGRQVRDWMHVDDHADAVAAVLDRGQTGSTYNVAAGEPRTNIDLVESLLAIAGKPHSLVRHVPDRPGHDRRYALDAGRISNLGWRPQVALSAGLASTVAWYQANVAWWRNARAGDWDAYYEQQYGWRLSASKPA